MPRFVACPTCGRPYEKRTPEQNDKMWPMLRDISKQVCWHGRWLEDHEWKEMFSAALKKQKIVPAIDGGGFVVIGASTSKMPKKDVSDIIEMAYAFGADRGVKWTEPVHNE